MNTTRSHPSALVPFSVAPFALAFAAAALLVSPAIAPARAGDELTYADKDGTRHDVALEAVTKSDGEKFIARILVGGRRKTLRLEARQIVKLDRGDPDSINQWSKRRAHGKRLMAAGRIANEGPASGAEETFANANVHRGKLVETNT